MKLMKEFSVKLNPMLKRNIAVTYNNDCFRIMFQDEPGIMVLEKSQK